MAQVITIRTRKALPDVPDDIEVHLAHLNDPNYTFDNVHDWEEDSFELNDKTAPLESPLPHHKLYEPSDIETQSYTSRSSSHCATSRAPLQSDT